MTSGGCSLSIPSHVSINAKNDDADCECESVSEAGDVGDRALPSTFSFDNNAEENGALVSLSEDHTLQPCHPNSSLEPLPPQLTSTMASQGAKQIQESRKGLPELLDYAFCLVHLAVFGIRRVLTRYLLQKLFGPGHAGVTSNQTILYLDLPSNMVGSFLMGWFGVAFKDDISRVSKHIPIAITSGYLGSLTTFSGWNQKMLELCVSGHWLFSALGFLIGMFLIAFSIIFEIETAKGFRWLLNRLNMSSGAGNSRINCKADRCRIQLAAMVMSLVILGALWGVSVALAEAKFKHGGSAAELWFACMVGLGPIGVWIRWFLARVNEYGLGKAGLFKWIPFGTLIANVSAACGVAALATVKIAVSLFK